MESSISHIIDGQGAAFTDAERQIISEAAEFSSEKRKKFRKAHGMMAYEHSVGVAKILRDMHLGVSSVVAGLFHDLYKKRELLKEVEDKFGEDITSLVRGFEKIDGLTHKTHISGNEDEYIRMVLSVSRDIRIVLLFIANRYFKIMNMDELSGLDTRLLGERTLKLYSPLAHRLGLGKFKAEMENVSFKILYPEIYNGLTAKLSEWRYKRERSLKQILMQLEYQFKNHGLSPQMTGRTKHIFSLYRKMERTGRRYEEIFDVLAIRSVVETVSDCYKILAVAQQYYKPILEEFDDYIQKPKPNGYQSLHVLLEDEQGIQFELQIRTSEMHKTAEFGVAAHWQYKEQKEADDVDSYFMWLREHIEFQGEVKGQAPVTRLFNLSFENNDIFVLTPRGDLKRLPRGSTPIDFAFAVHREIGLKCSGARVNGQMVPFQTELKNGDRVEILTSNRMTVNTDWMKYAHSQKARSLIRRWLREQMRAHSINLGEEILSRGFRRNKISWNNDNLSNICEIFDFSTVEDLLAAAGTGKLNMQAILQRLDGNGKADAVTTETQEPESIPHREIPDSITVGGMDSLMVKFAKCCMPIPGDPIVGYITRGKGVTVHRETCRNVKQIKKEPEREIEVTWGSAQESLFIAGLRLQLHKSDNFIKEITPTFGSKKILLVNYQFSQTVGRNFCILVIQVRNTQDLKVFMNNLHRMRVVKSVVRLQFAEYKSLIRNRPVGLGSK